LQKQTDPFYFTKYTVVDKKIEIAKPDYFMQKSIYLRNCKFAEETSWFEPIKGVLKLGEAEYADCWIYPKNISCAVIEFETAHSVQEGELVTILKKKGKNSKVYLTGKVKYIVVEEKTPIPTQEGKERAKVDYTRDF